MKKSSEKKIVFIVGSHPSADFPSIEPDVVVAANGAIHRIQKFYGKAKTIGIVNNAIFQSPNNETLLLLKNCKVDELIVIKFHDKKNIKISPARSSIIYKKIKYISRLQKTYIELSGLSNIRFIKYVIRREKLIGCLSALLYFLRSKKLMVMKTSTGVFGLAYMKTLKLNAFYFIVGIGFDSNQGHFYAPDKKYGSGHLDSDVYYLYDSINNKGNKVVFTDSIAEKMFNEYVIKLKLKQYGNN